MRTITSILFVISLAALMNPDAKAACRSASVKHQFDVSQGYKHGRKGFIVDHFCALVCGGIDDIKNMQYQTISDSKAKDRWESTSYGCKKTCNKTNSTPTRQVFNCK
jgi:hypothetical protein